MGKRLANLNGLVFKFINAMFCELDVQFSIDVAEGNVFFFMPVNSECVKGDILCLGKLIFICRLMFCEHPSSTKNFIIQSIIGVRLSRNQQAGTLY